MTKNNNKSVLVALLLAPLLTAGFTVGNIPQAEAVPEIPFEVSLECEAISADTILWTAGITNLSGFTSPFVFQLVLETSDGIFFDDAGSIDVDPLESVSITLETSEGPSVYTGTFIVTNDIGEPNSDTATCVILPPPIIFVDIDIKPGSFPNSININSMGLVPVAILTTSDFDATNVNPDTLIFMAADDAIGDPEDYRNCVRHGIEDVDGDGDLDLVCKFPQKTTWITCETFQGVILGETNDGQGIIGFDSINPVGKDCRNNNDA